MPQADERICEGFGSPALVVYDDDDILGTAASKAQTWRGGKDRQSNCRDSQPGPATHSQAIDQLHCPNHRMRTEKISREWNWLVVREFAPRAGKPGSGRACRGERG